MIVDTLADRAGGRVADRLDAASDDRAGERLVEVRGVSREFAAPGGLLERAAALLPGHRGGARRVIRAVDGVDLAVARREVVGLVGESGCGKSTLGRLVTGHLAPTRGAVLLEGRDRAALSGQDAVQARLRAQMVFQDPFGSLNPRMRLADIVGEAPLAHGLVTRGDLPDYVAGLLRRTGLDPAYGARFPHQCSGGQRQRVGIARALAVRPDLLVCDEAVAALDVSIQAQIINLFLDLRDELRLTYLFISHDLGVIRHLSDRVVVMYLGRVVEEAPTDALFERPNHPYSRSLLANLPRLHARDASFATVKGEIPSALNPPLGCHFHPRCPFAMPRCRTEAPRLRAVAPGHRSACHLNEAV